MALAILPQTHQENNGEKKEENPFDNKKALQHFISCLISGCPISRFNLSAIYSGSTYVPSISMYNRYQPFIKKKLKEIIGPILQRNQDAIVFGTWVSADGNYDHMVCSNSGLVLLYGHYPDGMVALLWFKIVVISNGNNKKGKKDICSQQIEKKATEYLVTKVQQFNETHLDRRLVIICLDGDSSASYLFGGIFDKTMLDYNHSRDSIVTILKRVFGDLGDDFICQTDINAILICWCQIAKCSEDDETRKQLFHKMTREHFSDPAYENYQSLIEDFLQQVDPYIPRVHYNITTQKNENTHSIRLTFFHKDSNYNDPKLRNLMAVLYLLIPDWTQFFTMLRGAFELEELKPQFVKKLHTYSKRIMNSRLKRARPRIRRHLVIYRVFFRRGILRTSRRTIDYKSRAYASITPNFHNFAEQNLVILHHFNPKKRLYGFVVRVQRDIGVKIDQLAFGHFTEKKTYCECYIWVSSESLSNIKDFPIFEKALDGNKGLKVYQPHPDNKDSSNFFQNQLPKDFQMKEIKKKIEEKPKSVQKKKTKKNQQIQENAATQETQEIQEPKLKISEKDTSLETKLQTIDQLAKSIQDKKRMMSKEAALAIFTTDEDVKQKIIQQRKEGVEPSVLANSQDYGNLTALQIVYITKEPDYRIKYPEQFTEEGKSELFLHYFHLPTEYSFYSVLQIIAHLPAFCFKYFIEPVQPTNNLGLMLRTALIEMSIGHILDIEDEFEMFKNVIKVTDSKKIEAKMKPDNLFFVLHCFFSVYIKKDIDTITPTARILWGNNDSGTYQPKLIYLPFPLKIQISDEEAFSITVDREIHKAMDEKIENIKGLNPNFTVLNQTLIYPDYLFLFIPKESSSFKNNANLILEFEDQDTTIRYQLVEFILEMSIIEKRQKRPAGIVKRKDRPQNWDLQLPSNIEVQDKIPVTQFIAFCHNEKDWIQCRAYQTELVQPFIEKEVDISVEERIQQYLGCNVGLFEGAQSARLCLLVYAKEIKGSVEQKLSRNGFDQTFSGFPSALQLRKVSKKSFFRSAYQAVHQQEQEPHQQKQQQEQRPKRMARQRKRNPKPNRSFVIDLASMEQAAAAAK